MQLARGEAGVDHEERDVVLALGAAQVHRVGLGERLALLEIEQPCDPLDHAGRIDHHEGALAVGELRDQLRAVAAILEHLGVGRDRGGRGALFTPAGSRQEREEIGLHRIGELERAVGVDRL